MGCEYLVRALPIIEGIEQVHLLIVGSGPQSVLRQIAASPAY